MSKTAERRDEYIEFAYMGIPMSFGVIEKAQEGFVPTLTVWAPGDDDGAKIAFEIMSGRLPKKTYSSVSDARDAVNEILVRESRIVIGTWKRGEASSTVKCKACHKQVSRNDTACVRDRNSLAFACLDQCIYREENDLFEKNRKEKP